MRCILIVVLLFIYAIPAVAEDCGHIGFIKDFVKLTDLTVTGYYFHPDHCFSVILPEGIIGRYSSQTVSNHGFGVILPNEKSTDYLLVQGDWGAILDEPENIPGSLKQIVSLRLKWLKEKNVVILKKSVTDTLLDNIQAKQFVCLYKCKDTGMQFWEDSIIAIDTSGSIFEITLYSSSQTYEISRSIRNSIAKTWKYEGKKCAEKFQK